MPTGTASTCSVIEGMTVNLSTTTESKARRRSSSTSQRTTTKPRFHVCNLEHYVSKQHHTFHAWGIKSHSLSQLLPPRQHARYYNFHLSAAKPSFLSRLLLAQTDVNLRTEQVTSPWSRASAFKSRSCPHYLAQGQLVQDVQSPHPRHFWPRPKSVNRFGGKAATVHEGNGRGRGRLVRGDRD